MDETKQIGAILVIEVLGRPPEALKEALEKIINQMGEEKGVEIVEKTIHEAVPLKNKEGLFTSFAEIEIKVEELLILSILMFKYMPSHIEIVAPEFIALTNNGWGDVLNEITRRLHGYDEIVKVLQAEKTILENKLRELSKNVPKESKEKS